MIAALVVLAALHPPKYQERPLPPYCETIRRLAEVIGADAINPELIRRCRIFHSKED